MILLWNIMILNRILFTRLSEKKLATLRDSTRKRWNYEEMIKEKYRKYRRREAKRKKFNDIM